jgi:nucleoside-diphosphate-sugar epimerase
MADYLITGCAGFIASRVCELLLEQGHSVLGVDNLNDAYDVRMKEYRLSRLLDRPGFRFAKLDIADPGAVLALRSSDGFAAVINLAARAGVRQAGENPWVYVDTNLTGTLNLLELCRRTDIPKFVLASTSSIYGADAPLPTPETASSDRPLQAYAASKKAAEAMCHAFHHLYGTDITIFRFFTVYGPAGRPDMSMFRFVQWISEGRPVIVNGNGEQTRGFTYLDDIARGVILGLQPSGYEIINLGGHESIRINALIEMMEELIGKKAQIVHRPLHPADMLASLADVTKARALLGWQPQVFLGEGVRRMIEWYRAEQSWASTLVTE